MKLLQQLVSLKPVNDDQFMDQRRILLHHLLLVLIPGVVIFNLAVFVLKTAIPFAPIDSLGLAALYTGSLVFTIFGTFLFFLNKHTTGGAPSVLFVLVMLIVMFIVDLPENIIAGRSLLVFTIPIFLSSFLIVPAASFIVALFSLAVVIVIGRMIDQRPEYISMVIFFIIALISWLTSNNLKGLFDRLEKSRIRSQAIFNTTLNSVFLIDSQENVADCNPAAVDLSGYDRNEIIGKKVWNFIADIPEDRKQHFIRKITTNGRLKGEAKFKRKDGTEFPVEFIAVLNILEGINLAVIWDTSDRIAAERAMHESREFVRMTFEYLKDAVFIIDMKMETIIEVNPAASVIFGYSKESIIGCTPEFLHINEASHETFNAHIASAVEQQGFLGQFLYAMKKKDGTIFPTEHMVVPVLDSGGTKKYWVSVVRDITERKRLEEQLFHSQKMDALGRLAGGITHDFNNLLTTIFGYCDIGRGSDANDPVSVECFSEIKKAAEKAAGLTSRLLAFSRRQVLSPKSININDLLLGMKSILGRLIVENITINYELDENVDLIIADPLQIEQIVINMIVNSGDAMPKGGAITITTGNQDFDEAFADNHPEIQPGEYVMLGISDTGSGMNDMTMKRIFDPFFTTKKQGKGTGMGLAIVFGVVKQSHGHIQVWSEPGKGSSFRLYFPKMKETAKDTRPVLASYKKYLVGNERILIVEDDDALRKMIIKTLGDFGYTTVEAANGKEAIAIFEQSRDCPFDLVVTDIIMPEMSGQELIERVQELCPAIKVLYISGYTDNMVFDHGISDTGMMFLQKPFSQDDITRKVRVILNGGPAGGV